MSDSPEILHTYASRRSLLIENAQDVRWYMWVFVKKRKSGPGHRVNLGTCL